MNMVKCMNDTLILTTNGNKKSLLEKDSNKLVLRKYMTFKKI